MTSLPSPEKNKTFRGTVVGFENSSQKRVTVIILPEGKTEAQTLYFHKKDRDSLSKALENKTMRTIKMGQKFQGEEHYTASLTR